MPISAIDVSTLAPRSAEASNLVGREQQQLQHVNENSAVNVAKNTEQKAQKTVETEKSDTKEYRFDGSGGNGYQAGNRKRKKEKKDEAPMAPRSDSSFDIMI
nr:hypothetical protein [Eubacterium sp.]